MRILVPLVCLSLLSLSPSPVSGTGIDSLRGCWSGALVRDGSVQALDLCVDDDGATYDIPDLGFYGLPVGRLDIDGDRVALEVLYGTFVGSLHRPGRELALVNDGLQSPITLHLKPALAPIGCAEHDLSFATDVPLAATILAPPGPGPFPGVVVLHDSGPRARNARSYRVYAEVLCRHGFTALVYDKRGVGDSGGNFDRTAIWDLARDAAAAARTLRRQHLAPTSSVGMIGFSQGGWVGPMAAGQVEIDWLALLAGPAVSVWDQEVQRVEGEMRRDGRPESEITAALAHTRLIFASVDNATLRSEALESSRVAAMTAWADYVDLPESDEEIEAWRLERYDPVDVLRGTSTPTLAIFGSDDPRVPPVPNAELMREYLLAAGNSDFRIVVLDHFPHKIYAGQGYIGSGERFPERIWRWDRVVPGIFPEVIAFGRAHARVGKEPVSPEAMR